ncbi:fasciclin domain-containing protein [Lyngbya sp. PCC 8106]|uniref:fasciclin domain-containing protein n=1 Tax=Lyngbya sp. (strain PCC 8106) TaxID=313612 RepID=UPI0000EA9F63|nr:fasciclin domain-containing protein [Lyngbya sp. PCC 8106]EAW36746.1 Beta-Ig-H3/fasciclin [Lyngbya sp. PCC 8106]
MKSLNTQLPKVLLATIVSLSGLVTVSAVGNLNRAVANEYRGSSSMSQEMSSKQSIVGELSESASFNTLEKAVEAAGLADTLKNTGDYTVFAPTDEAFAALPPRTLEALLQPENQETLRRILLYHVVLGAADSSEISSGFFETAEGSGVNIDVANGMVVVEGAEVIEADLRASNGVVHAIDAVILPPDISAAQLQELTAAR